MVFEIIMINYSYGIICIQTDILQQNSQSQVGVFHLYLPSSTVALLTSIVHV